MLGAKQRNKKAEDTRRVDFQSRHYRSTRWSKDIFQISRSLTTLITIMRLEAINNYVTFELIEEQKVDTGGLILAGAAKKESRWGRVLTIGDGLPDITGVVIPLDVEVGDVIYLTAHGKERIPLDQVGDASSAVYCASVLDVLGKMKDGVFIPLGSLVVIDKFEAVTEKDGLKVADGITAAPNIAKVKTLGTGWRTPEGARIPFHVEEGDTIAYLPFQEMVIDMSPLGVEDELHLVQHGSILGKFI